MPDAAQPPVDLPALPEHALLSDLARGHVVAALVRHARGERLTWDVALTVVASPQGPQPLVLVYLHMPSAVLGEVVGELVFVPPAEITATNVDHLVGQAIGRMRATRSGTASAPAAGLLAPRR